MPSNHDASGRFAPGNNMASKGGKARAKKLSRRRRRQIARQGWEALVAKRFGGHEGIARAYMRRHARYYGDPYREDALSFGDAHPGTPEEFMAESLARMGDLSQEIDFGMK